MDLHTLLAGWAIPDYNCAITGLSADSRQINVGDVFVLLTIEPQVAARYVAQAIDQGVQVILHDRQLNPLDFMPPKPPAHLPIVVALDALETQLGVLAARFYAQPSQHLNIIGITGTNGKTSCSQFLAQLLEHCGIIGTLGWGEWGNLTPTGYTTPDALTTQKLLADLCAQGKQQVAMEVSSHGLAEGRVNGIRFTGVALTNISRDHLDFHGSMTAYIETKKTLFTRADNQFAVINLNEPLCEQFIAVVPPSVKRWGFQVLSPKQTVGAALAFDHVVYAEHLQAKAAGLGFRLRWRTQQADIDVPLYGAFNVDNVLTVATIMLALGYPFLTVVERLARLEPINGRMQRLGTAHSALIFVDYAHTPDALEKALLSAKAHCTRELWVVFGCGGDRDQGKRPQMGACAARHAQHVIITDDNPRSESPAFIATAILEGCHSVTKQANINIIHDRAVAIQTAIHQAGPEDCIVIAGKGHETYQEINARKIPFSDVQVVNHFLTLQSSA